MSGFNVVVLLACWLVFAHLFQPNFMWEKVSNKISSGLMSKATTQGEMGVTFWEKSGCICQLPCSKRPCGNQMTFTQCTRWKYALGHPASCSDWPWTREPTTCGCMWTTSHPHKWLYTSQRWAEAIRGCRERLDSVKTTQQGSLAEASGPTKQ